MISVDLITGFLGSGKTTFLKRYATYLMEQGLTIGILENDYGAVNVDMMLLQDLEGDNCTIETVAGGCDTDCHYRRFKTKLIALGMSGCDRVLIEPSGIFDVDEFFDVLREEPLERWYEIGNVIAVCDAGLEETFSAESEYLLASQVANAGCVVLSKTQNVDGEQIDRTVSLLGKSLAAISCSHGLTDNMIIKDWDCLTKEDYDTILNCGYVAASYVKKYEGGEVYQSLYYMNLTIGEAQIKDVVRALFADEECGDIFRIKGFLEEDGEWRQLNATAAHMSFAPIDAGQRILIVIGENLCRERIDRYFSSYLPEE